MAFRLVSSGGNVTDPAVINIRCSGTVWPGGVVEFLPTSGQGVSKAASTSSNTTIFGISLDYREGASDQEIRVIPFAPGQLWEADCVRAAATAHINLKQMLRDALYLENIAVDSDGIEGIFENLYVSSSTSGSGKIVGRFLPRHREA